MEKSKIMVKKVFKNSEKEISLTYNCNTYDLDYFKSFPNVNDFLKAINYTLDDGDVVKVDLDENEILIREEREEVIIDLMGNEAPLIISASSFTLDNLSGCMIDNDIVEIALSDLSEIEVKTYQAIAYVLTLIPEYTGGYTDGEYDILDDDIVTIDWWDEKFYVDLLADKEKIEKEITIKSVWRDQVIGDLYVIIKGWG